MTTTERPTAMAPDFFTMPVPEVDPDPVPMSREELLQPQTEFETILYAMAYQQPERAKALMKRWFELLPDYTGEPDDRDVWPPTATAPIEVPRHYRTTPVHSLPGGFANDRTLRLSLLGKRQYYFTREDNLQYWIPKVHGHRSPSRILDMGCGTATTTFTYAATFPNAEVFGIDLSAPYIRFDREQAEARGVANIHFYKDNAESTHFPDNHFDLVHFTYVLHEMPQKNARRILAEIMRVLKPGGTVSAMDVFRNPDEKARNERVKRTKRGEPFLAEYMRLNLPVALEQTGFQNVEEHEANQDGIFLTATKPG